MRPEGGEGVAVGGRVSQEEGATGAKPGSSNLCVCEKQQGGGEWGLGRQGEGAGTSPEREGGARRVQD